MCLQDEIIEVQSTTASLCLSSINYVRHEDFPILRKLTLRFEVLERLIYTVKKVLLNLLHFIPPPPPKFSVNVIKIQLIIFIKNVNHRIKVMQKLMAGN